MPDHFSIQVRGLSELSETLRTIPLQLSQRIIRKGLEAAGDVVKLAAEATAPVLTGLLKEDIITKTYVSGDAMHSSVIIGPGYDRSKLSVHKKGSAAGKLDSTSSPGVYGKFVELGTRKMPPHPWLRPAWEASKNAALDTFIAYVREGLAIVAAAARRA